MLFEYIVQSKDFLNLKREMDRNSFPKSLMLISKDSTYVRQFAKAVSMLIFDGKINLKSESSNKVIVESHPDLKIYPTKDKLIVADSEQIVEESHIKPIFSNKKIFIINSFDLATESAQNKLLKVLEEPSRNVYLILTCSNPHLVLPTIRSRCNKIELGKIVDEEIVKLLPKLSDEDVALVLACSDAQVGKALELAKMKNFSNFCQSCVSVFTQMKTSKQVLKFSRELCSFKADFTLMLEILTLICEDLIKLKSGEYKILKLTPFADLLKSCQSDYTVRALCQIAYLIEKVAEEKEFNINLTLALENLLLNILEVKYLCK